ncbi:MAG: C40 family peptidase [Actinomycetes bacterium]
MSKHRRPRTISRAGRRPVHLGIAAGVAGTVAVTGTVVASAATSVTPETQPVSFTPQLSDSARAALDFQAQREQLAAEKRLSEIREAKALAEAKRKAAAKRAAERREAKRKAAAERRAEARRLAEERAAAARAEEQASRSRSDGQMSASAAHVLEIAAAQEGDSYSYGAAGPDSFDCSGFTQYVFGKVGISLPHSSSAQADVARSVSSPQPGDLVFVHNGGGGSIGHVAIYAGDGYWYEASNPDTGVGKHRAWSTNVSYGSVL